MPLSSSEPAGPPAGQESRSSRRASSTGGPAAGAARSLNRLAGGAVDRLGQATGGAANRLRAAGGRARGVATSPPAKRLLSAAGTASALGAAASLAGRSGRRRHGGLAGTLDSLLAGPAAAYRRQRRRQRVRAAGRLLGGVATAPLRAAGSLGTGLGRRAPAPPRPLSRKRRSKMAGNFKLAVGLAAGYVLGTRAGRERYERLAEAARNVADRPEVQQLTGKLRGSLGTGIDKAAGSAGDRLQRARAGAERPDRGSAGWSRSEQEQEPHRRSAGQPRSEQEPVHSTGGPTSTVERSRSPEERSSSDPDAGDQDEQRREGSRASRATRR